jgi:carbonic anhydrase
MDYRLVDDIVRYMEGRGLTNKYDHAVLAGAALGALQQKKRAWGATFWEHVDVAIQLHSIHKVIVMDHRDCGAYRVFLGEKAVADVASETKVHTAKLRELGKAIRRKHRKIEVELLLMDLQGQVEVIPA